MTLSVAFRHGKSRPVGQKAAGRGAAVIASCSGRDRAVYPAGSKPLSPIQNNSDLGQGSFRILWRMMHRDIYLAPGGVHGTET
jgi:hypothetical protein